MKRVDVDDARESLESLLDAVESGEHVIITRDNKDVAQLKAINEIRFKDRSELRKSLPFSKNSSLDTVNSIREEKVKNK